MLGDVLTVQARVAQNLRERGAPGDVAVTILNGTDLRVGLVNSPVRLRDIETKERVAKEVADIAFRAYPRPGLQRVQVAFVIHHSYLGLFHYSDSRDAFNFNCAP